MFKWINDNSRGIEFEKILFQKGYLTFQDVKEILKLEEQEKEVKTKYRLGFSFYHNNELHKVAGIYINSKGQVLYKCMTFLGRNVCYVILLEAQINQIIGGTVDGQKPDVHSS